jgi:hypothetical protein
MNIKIGKKTKNRPLGFRPKGIIALRINMIKAKLSGIMTGVNQGNWRKRTRMLNQFLYSVSLLRKELTKKTIINSTDSSAAICEKTGTREWDKTDTPPTTITLSTIRHGVGFYSLCISVPNDFTN